MKVLLLGEFSSLHKYLKEGLLELGVEVKFGSDGDVWKKVGGGDFELIKRGANDSYIKKIKSRIFDQYKLVSHLKGYDIVQLINPHIFYPIEWPHLIRSIKRNNRRISLCAAGDDYAVFCAYKKHFMDYYAYDYDKRIYDFYNRKNISGLLRIKNYHKTIELSDIIIPSSYVYEKAYSCNSKCTRTILFPINCKTIEYKENRINEKIIFFHGINRELAKGTYFIRSALERLQYNYPNDVEIIIDGKMPFDKYVKVLSKTNVLLDQCTSYCYGINSCVAMAEGKVVLSGNHSAMRSHLGIDPPVIGIKPDVDYIYKKLIWILENKNKISEIGYKSRKYIEEYHDHVKIAQQYMDEWNKII